MKLTMQTPEITMPDTPDKFDTASSRWVDLAERLEITSDQHYERADAILNESLSPLLDEIEAHHKPIVDALNEATATVRAQRDKVRKPIENAIAIWKSKMLDYATRREREAREAREKLEREAREKEEARKALEAERLRKEAAERAAKAKTALEKNEVKRLEQQAEAVESEPVRIEKSALPATPSLGGKSQVRRTWKVDREEVDLDRLIEFAFENKPFRKLLSVDFKAADKLAKALKETFPDREECGLTAFEDKALARGSRK